MALQQVGSVYGRCADVDEDLIRPGNRVGYLLPHQSVLLVLVCDDGLQNDGTRMQGKTIRGTVVERSAIIPRQARETGGG